jgi:type I restriction enzyme S subunit
MNPTQLLEHFDRISEAPDAIPRLRRFILDLAVRGKLVEQDPNDEPASELIKRIEAKKASLVKIGKIRKQELMLSVEIEDQPFELPNKWQWVRFGWIADFSGGRTPSRHDSSFWNTGDYPWVSIADMKDGDDIIATKETVSEKAKQQVFNSEPVPVGTLIMSFKLTIGKISRLAVPAFHNEAIISIHPLLQAMDTYLFKVLPQFSRQGDTKDAMKGATLNRDSIANIFVPLPPIAEQHRIVAKVDELMALCDQLEAAKSEREQSRDRLVAASLQRLNQPADDAETFRDDARFTFNHLPRITTRPAHIKQLRQTILNLAVRGKLVAQCSEDGTADSVIEAAKHAKEKILEEWNFRQSKSMPLIRSDELSFDIPKTWRWERIGNIAAVKGGKRLPKGVPFSKERTPYIYIRVTDMKNQTVAIDDLKYIDDNLHRQLSRYIIEKMDIYVVIVGATIGKTGIIPPELHRMHLTENAAKLMFREVYQKYLLTILQSDFVQSQFVEKTNQQAQPKLALERIESTLVPIPPLAEQHRIAAKVDELMALCDQLETQLTATEADSRRLLEAVLHETLSPALAEAA